MFGVPSTKKFFQDGQAYTKEVKSHGDFHGRLKFYSAQGIPGDGHRSICLNTTTSP